MDVQESQGPRKSAKERKQNKKNQQSNPGDRPQVIIPYVEKVSETVERVLRNHQVPVVIRPFNTLKRMLVHPKDKQEKEEKTKFVRKFLVVIVTRRMLVRQEESLG